MDTRTSIAEAAAHEFLNRGYAGTTLSSIAQRLGLTKGALTYHFRAKSEFAAQFMRVVRAATAQASAFSQDSCPDCAACRILLDYLQLRTWRQSEPQFAAGLALLMDMASPIFEADVVVQEWLAISVDAFEECRAAGEMTDGMDPVDAAEMLVVMNLSELLFGRHLRFAAGDVTDLRFTRFVLNAVGVPDVDEHVQQVLERFSGTMPRLQYPG